MNRPDNLHSRILKFPFPGTLPAEPLPLNGIEQYSLQYDLQGKPIMKRPFKIFAGESTTNVKTDELKTGAYVYSITIGDAQINSGKFVISR